ncbi:hypothetical protein OVN18_07430 [Microcella daejeonensis]|uniref:Uncharacterized protein n=1 Tax=Microcella daejeonensis TaxID=2994971 RepID=A0A9E8S7R5_9MICO|nr:hypothetical protein [Microcella daejeonensis]WAB80408.1 hypothetical protein OVN18_07430 [Microcella daejeonensis]
MGEQLSKVDTTQLQRWAYGRAITPDERARAAEAANELQRRADALQKATKDAESERLAVESMESGSGVLSSRGAADDESRSSPNHRKALAGVIGVGVLLALVSSAFVFADNSQSAGALAVFETEETQLDRNWASRLESWGYSGITAGPRTAEVGDGYILIAARVSTVPEGRSTEWDSYCLFLASPGTDNGSWALSESCTSPDHFERDGTTVVAQVTDATDQAGVASWGPTDGPRFDASKSVDELSAERGSALDLLANPLARYSGESRILSGVVDPDDLLMGPSVVHDAPIPSGEVVSVQIHLRDAMLPTAGSEPELCMTVAHTESASSQTCKPLQAALDSGISLIEVIAGDSWLIGVDETGAVQVQRD